MTANSPKQTRPRQKIRKVVFPVAGLGTRILPATKSIPKEMLPVVDRPLIQYVVDEAAEAGIEHFIFVTGRGKGAIEDYFDQAYELNATLNAKSKTSELDILAANQPAPGQMSFTRQQEPLGLGHAVWCARDIVGDEPFAVILPDELVMGDRSCLAQMVEAYEQTGGNIVAVEEVPRQDTDRYGIVDPGETTSTGLIEVKGLVEKPKPEEAPSTLSLTGRYILVPEIFTPLAKEQKGAGGEIQLTDAMAELIGKHPFHASRFNGTRYDCGNRVGLIAANLAYALARPELSDDVRAAATALLTQS